MGSVNGFKSIDEMFAFVAIDEEDGSEGICSFQGPMGHMPMVGADMERVEQFRPIAQQMADQFGVEVKILKFSVRSEVDTIKPSEE